MGRKFKILMSIFDNEKQWIIYYPLIRQIRMKFSKYLFIYQFSQHLRTIFTSIYHHYKIELLRLFAKKGQRAYLQYCKICFSNSKEC